MKSSTNALKLNPVKKPLKGEIYSGLKCSIVFKTMPNTTLINITPIVVGSLSHLWLM